MSSKTYTKPLKYLAQLGRIFQEGPPDLDDLIKKWMKGMQNKKKHGSVGPTASGSAPSISFKPLLIACLIIWFLLGFYIVQPAEQAVLLRFGAYNQTVGPGMHWTPPIITRRFIVDVHKVYDFSYGTDMLTQDENIVDIKLSVWFKVTDPKAFLFNVKTPTTSLVQATASSLRQVVGRTTLDDILTTGRATATADIQKELTVIFNRYNTGIEIQDLNLQPAKPPEAVTDAFDDAIKAREDEQRYINEAQAFAEQVLNKAGGQAARITQEANAYKERVILDAKAEIAPFLALLKAYHTAPALVKKRLSLETFESIFSDVNKLIVPENIHLTYLPGLSKQSTAQSKEVPAIPLVLNAANSANNAPTQTQGSLRKTQHLTSRSAPRANWPSRYTINRSDRTRGE